MHIHQCIAYTSTNTHISLLPPLPSPPPPTQSLPDEAPSPGERQPGAGAYAAGTEAKQRASSCREREHQQEANLTDPQPQEGDSETQGGKQSPALASKGSTVPSSHHHSLFPLLPPSSFPSTPLLPPPLPLPVTSSLFFLPIPSQQELRRSHTALGRGHAGVTRLRSIEESEIDQKQAK